MNRKRFTEEQIIGVLREHEDGDLWTSATNGVHCYEPEGSVIDIIKIPERVANVCFGGPKGNRLFVCLRNNAPLCRLFACKRRGKILALIVNAIGAVWMKSRENTNQKLRLVLVSI